MLLLLYAFVVEILQSINIYILGLVCLYIAGIGLRNNLTCHTFTFGYQALKIEKSKCKEMAVFLLRYINSMYISTIRSRTGLKQVLNPFVD